MRNYLFILSFITITIINGCTYTNLTENQIYKSKQNYKCDIKMLNVGSSFGGIPLRQDTTVPIEK